MASFSKTKDGKKAPNTQELQEFLDRALAWDNHGKKAVILPHSRLGKMTCIVARIQNLGARNN